MISIQSILSFILFVYTSFLSLDLSPSSSSTTISSYSGPFFFNFLTVAVAKPLNQEEIQQADIYVAEVSEDLSERLLQLLHKDFTYHRYPLEITAKDEEPEPEPEPELEPELELEETTEKVLEEDPAPSLEISHQGQAPPLEINDEEEGVLGEPVPSLEINDEEEGVVKEPTHSLEISVEEPTPSFEIYNNHHQGEAPPLEINDEAEWNSILLPLPDINDETIEWARTSSFMEEEMEDQEIDDSYPTPVSILLPTSVSKRQRRNFISFFISDSQENLEHRKDGGKETEVEDEAVVHHKDSKSSSSSSSAPQNDTDSSTNMILSDSNISSNDSILSNYTPYLSKDKHGDSSPSLPFSTTTSSSQEDIEVEVEEAEEVVDESSFNFHEEEFNKDQDSDVSSAEPADSNLPSSSKTTHASTTNASTRPASTVTPSPAPPLSQQDPHQNSHSRSRFNSTETACGKNRGKNGNNNNCKSSTNFYHGLSIEEQDLLTPRNTTEWTGLPTIPFDFTVECMDDEEECYYINDKLENAGTYISNVFNIYQTINVDVHILPFCKYMGGSNCNSITALTYAPSFVTLNITRQGLYSYPQALVKQLVISDQVKNYASYDISLYFNTDYLRENNYGNYLLVATHELIHGMGFFHLMTTASAAFKMDFPQDRIIPQPLVHNYRTTAGDERAYQGWIPFTVFDRYLVEVGNPATYLHHGIQGYLEDVQAHKFLSEEDVLEHFEKNVTLPAYSHAYSKYLIQPFTTREAIGFRAYDGEVITLQTFKEYEPMSSISHIHAPFSCDSAFNCFVPKEKLNEVDENYLMYYTIITRSINDLVERFSGDSVHGFIGEKIVKILKTMGWTEKQQDTTYFKLYENDILAREAAMSDAPRSRSQSRSRSRSFLVQQLGWILLISIGLFYPLHFL